MQPTPGGFFVSRRSYFKGECRATKVAILIDGAYLLKRLPSLSKKYRQEKPAIVADAIRKITIEHLRHQSKSIGTFEPPKHENEPIIASNPMSLLYRKSY